MVIDYGRIKNFWQWFESVSNEIFEPSENSSIITKLDGWIYTLNDRLDWELGPVEEGQNQGSGSKYYFSVSPCLDDGLVFWAKEIIRLAPLSDKWLFLSAKPLKGWTPQFNMLNELGKGIEVDATTWKYRLFKFDDGTFDMDVWVDYVDGNLKTKYTAVEILITNLLGEERFMRTIKDIQIVKEINRVDALQWSDLRNLEAHLNQLE